jgi:hypothetical protein
MVRVKRATIIRRSLVGLVCTVGVGALYLAPSLAGPPEQIAVPAPTEMPSIEPTPFETPTDMPIETPTPTDTTSAVPLPTETSLPDAPTSLPTTTFPTIDPTTIPPYVPPETTKPKKVKTTKPPPVPLGEVTVTASNITPFTFTAKWDKVANAKGYTLDGCGLKTVAVTSKVTSKKIGFSKKCSLKVHADGSGSYKDGPETTISVKPIYGQPVISSPKDGDYINAEDFDLTWGGSKHSVDTTKYEVTTLCLYKKTATASPVEISFNGETGCVISVKALGDDNYGESEPTEIKVKKGIAPTTRTASTPSPSASDTE